MLIVFFLWGVRSGQFADQERARYLALDSGIPEECNSTSNRSKDDSPPSRPPPSGGRGQAQCSDSRGGDFRSAVGGSCAGPSSPPLEGEG
ncbi:hypothetical protein KOL99_03095 [Geomonas sp. Red51]|nr:hypothetical protein [Geomonas azotofigens]